MIALDASAAIQWLLQTSAGGRVEQRIFSRSESEYGSPKIPLDALIACVGFFGQFCAVAH